ncbi:MAG: DUF1573 domain-containing protein [Flavobacteriales bacterium]|nr:DUF1573 domain-containing protein [Flavobacteriales bacterium]
MKKLILAVAVALSSFAMVSAQSEIVNGPSIIIDKEVHDYGTIAYGSDGTCDFKVTNNGTAPLIISNCKGSCGCTVPKWDPNPILPGESSSIKVKYDTKRSGPINKSVTITSNAANEPTKVIRIKGTVEAGPDNGGSPVKPEGGAPNN